MDPWGSELMLVSVKRTTGAMYCVSTWELSTAQCVSTSVIFATLMGSGALHDARSSAAQQAARPIRPFTPVPRRPMPFILRGGKGKADAEGRPQRVRRGARQQLDGAALVLDEASRDRQPEAGAAFLAPGDEGVEHGVADRRRHSGTLIGQREHQPRHAVRVAA